MKIINDTTEPGLGCLEPYLTEAEWRILNDPDFARLVHDVNSVPGWQELQSIAVLSSIARNPSFEVFAEIGVFMGRSFLTFLLSNPNLNGVAVDTFQGTTGEHEEILKNVPSLRKAFEANLERFYVSCRASIFEGDSREIHTAFSDNSFDFIFIDGNHTYDYVKSDINNWYPKVKPGGILMGHDYNPLTNTQFIELRYAVDECVRFDKKYERFGCACGIWGAIKK